MDRGRRRGAQPGAAALIWLIGYGDIAARIGRNLQATEPEIHALSRQFRQPPAGLTPHQADLDRPSSLPEPAGCVIYTAPPPPQGNSDTRVQGLLPRLGKVEVLVYLSTSGVYGDCQGAWVDETRPPAPLTARARRRLDAEHQLQAWARRSGSRLVILRVPGIYGPGRLPRERLAKGLPILDPAVAPWSNRIHADDLARACALATQHGRGIYNLSDGTPQNMSAYFLACAEHFGLSPPPQLNWTEAQQEFSPQLLSFYQESRRLDISKAKRELGYAPRYPDLASGLAQCAQTGPTVSG